jgi:hypothetical protein
MYFPHQMRPHECAHFLGRSAERGVRSLCAARRRRQSGKMPRIDILNRFLFKKKLREMILFLSLYLSVSLPLSFSSSLPLDFSSCIMHVSLSISSMHTQTHPPTYTHQHKNKHTHPHPARVPDSLRDCAARVGDRLTRQCDQVGCVGRAARQGDGQPDAAVSGAAHEREREGERNNPFMDSCLCRPLQLCRRDFIG